MALCAGTPNLCLAITVLIQHNPYTACFAMRRWRPTPEVPLLLNPLFGLKSLLVNKSIRGYPISSDVVDVVPAVHVGHFMEQVSQTDVLTHDYPLLHSVIVIRSGRRSVEEWCSRDDCVYSLKMRLGFSQEVVICHVDSRSG